LSDRLCTPSGSGEQRAAEEVLIVAAVAADLEVTLLPARLRLPAVAAVDVDGYSLDSVLVEPGCTVRL